MHIHKATGNTYPCHDDTVTRPELGQSLEDQGGIILDYIGSAPDDFKERMIHTPLSFVNDKHLPSRCLLENRSEVFGTRNGLVSSNQDVIFRSSSALFHRRMAQLVFFDDFARCLLPIERYDPQLRSPLGELPDPVRYRRIRDHNQAWETIELGLEQTEEGDDLDGFALAESVS